MPPDHPDFDATSPSLRALAARGVAKIYPKNAMLITEGDVGTVMYIIRSGRVRVFSANDDGQEVTFGEYGPGEYVGELSLDGRPRSASVVTMERTVVSMVTLNTLLTHLKEEPQFALEMTQKLGFRLRLLTERARDFALSKAYVRLRNFFDRVAVLQPDGTRLTPHPMTHKEIAQHIGCTAGMVTRLIKGLEQHGCLVQEKKRYRLLRPMPPRW